MAEKPADFRSVFQYAPSAQYRLIDLISDSPLSSFDLRFFWQGVDGTLNPIYIPFNAAIEVKIAFIKKTIYNNKFFQSQEDTHQIF